MPQMLLLSFLSNMQIFMVLARGAFEELQGEETQWQNAHSTQVPKIWATFWQTKNP